MSEPRYSDGHQRDYWQGGEPPRYSWLEAVLYAPFLIVGAVGLVIWMVPVLAWSAVERLFSKKDEKAS